MSLGTLGTQNGTPVLPRNVLAIIIPSRNDGIRFFGRTFSKRKVEKWRTIKLEEWSKPTESNRPHGSTWSGFLVLPHFFGPGFTNVGTSASHWAHPLPCGPRCGTTFKARPRWRRVEINRGGELSPKKQDPPIHPNIYIYVTVLHIYIYICMYMCYIYIYICIYICFGMKIVTSVACGAWPRGLQK